MSAAAAAAGRPATPRYALWLRVAGTFALLSAGAGVMFAAGLCTLFLKRRFYSERIATPLGRLLLKLWGIRCVVHEHAPLPQGQVVYVSNHTSSIDMFVLIALGLRDTRFFLSGYLRKVVPLGVIGYLIGIFWTVDQKFTERRRRIFSRAADALRRSGESVYLSPEGERVTGGRIGPFNKGAFHLATALRAPIVPLYFSIPPAIDPGTGIDARPGVVHVHFLPPIETRNWRVEDVAANRDRVRELYLRWHAELRAHDGDPQ